MRAAGLQADGEIGDGDPIQAIEDAIRTFRPDELILSTHPEGRSHWLERGVVEKARERFEIELTHVVVDLGAPSADDRARRSAAASGGAARGAPLGARRRCALRRVGRGPPACARAARRLRVPGRPGRRTRSSASRTATTGAYGRWWTEHVAAALTAEQRALWLDPPHYEIVELHVRPARQRRGLGSALLAQLLTRQPLRPRRPDDAGGVAQGADVLREERLAGAREHRLRAGYPPYVALGNRLRRDRRQTVTCPSQVAGRLAHRRGFRPGRRHDVECTPIHSPAERGAATCRRRADVLRDGLDLGGGELALEGRHRAAADLDLMLRPSASEGFSWSRFGPTLPLEPASLSVWQPPQPAVAKTFLPSGARQPPPPPSWSSSSRRRAADVRRGDAAVRVAGALARCRRRCRARPGRGRDSPASAPRDRRSGRARRRGSSAPPRSRRS